jgi:DMSO/TMAO reductase YedYZ molybdopterin-dependent catalytic subunit
MKVVSAVLTLSLWSAWPGPSVAEGRAPKTDKADEVVIRVRGEVAEPLSLTRADLASLPRQSVQVKDHRGQDAVFDGVSLHEVLKKAGVKFGEELRGPGLALYVVAEASDGYRVVFALPELDPACTDRVVLLADRRDGAPLSNAEGPLRIVVPAEKRHARWIRQVVSLRVGRS